VREKQFVSIALIINFWCPRTYFNPVLELINESVSVTTPIGSCAPIYDLPRNQSVGRGNFLILGQYSTALAERLDELGSSKYPLCRNRTIRRLRNHDILGSFKALIIVGIKFCADGEGTVESR